MSQYSCRLCSGAGWALAYHVDDPAGDLAFACPCPKGQTLMRGARPAVAWADRKHVLGWYLWDDPRRPKDVAVWLAKRPLPCE